MSTHTISTMTEEGHWRAIQYRFSDDGVRWSEWMPLFSWRMRIERHARYQVRSLEDGQWTAVSTLRQR